MAHFMPVIYDACQFLELMKRWR